MKSLNRSNTAITLLIAVFVSVCSMAQQAEDLSASGLVANVLSAAKDGSLLATWVALDAPTGHEHLAISPLRQSLDSWSVDRNGNLIKTVGSGSPHSVIACGIDVNSYAISQITEEGYLRLHRIGRGSQHPLWDQSHEGQQLRILTRNGPYVAVSAVANGHFAAQHQDETALISADDLWVDVGADSAAEVAELGIQLLDPLVRNMPAWNYAEEVAGPGVGSRIGCAAVVAAAESSVAGQSITEKGRTTWILSTQQVFGWVGLGGALTRLAPVDELILVGPGEEQFRNEQISGVSRNFDRVLAFVGVESLRFMAAKVSNAGSLMERITLSDATELLQSLFSHVANSASLPNWIEAPVPDAIINPSLADLAADGTLLLEPADGSLSNPADGSLSEMVQLLDSLAETSAVPEHEGPVRAIVLDALPDWAKASANVDSMGNVWVTAGPEGGEATVFVAHMDEVGWDIASIEDDGVVNLTRRGGVVVSAWEGQPALLQLDSGTGAQSASSVSNLRGVFLTRNAAEFVTPETLSLERTRDTLKRPQQMRAWFGMDAAQLTAAGVRIGMGVTGYKEGHRLGNYRYASRSLDDRAGTTALLMAIKSIDPSKLTHRVVFCFSVQEEGGLLGAGALSARLGKDSRRVYSIDTFVTSDTPLESHHFAYAPLGNGPVLRSIENSSMATPYELDRNRTIAQQAGVDFQYGLTQGGTDGTTFTFWGAPNAGLSWPGRYSHSPAEILDLRDLKGLVGLILAMAEAEP